MESVEELEVKLQEAKRLKAEKEYEDNAISHLDRLFGAWGKKLEAVRGVKNGTWRLAIYPPAGPQWRYQGMLQAAFSFGHRFTMRSYFESHCRDWKDPHYYYSDTKEDLIPDGWELLRLFGIIFFIHRTADKFDPKEPYRPVADSWLPLEKNVLYTKDLDFTNPEVVEQQLVKVLGHELTRVSRCEQLAELQKKRDELEAQIDALKHQVRVTVEQVFPYSEYPEVNFLNKR
jgi:hypothetical protein